jgi:peptidoglycan/xylan/chitin deacetylase (PgdA/CDA1 family)
VYLHRVPDIIQKSLSKAVWSCPGHGAVYLSFDDGPTEYTEALLELLKKHGVFATFFLQGHRVEARPDLREKIEKEGHTVGNHGYAHLSGWKTDHRTYLTNLERGKELTKSKLYRPPYGRMTPVQWRIASEENTIIMWDVMPGDFDSSLTDQEVIDNVLDNVREGSIVVLHDNPRDTVRVLAILPTIIRGIKEKGFQMEALSSSHSS